MPKFNKPLNISKMIRKLISLLIISSILPFNLKAEWIPLTEKPSNQQPRVTLISDNNQSTVIEIEIPGYNIKEITADGKTYHVIDLLTESFTNEPGKPSLPYVAKILAIPDQAGISVEIIESSEPEVFQNIYLPPGRNSWYEGQDEPAFEENEQAYQSLNLYPAYEAQMGTPAIFRDFRIARLSVFPFRYVAAKKELHVSSSITVKINYDQGVVVNPKSTRTGNKIAPSFGRIYRSTIFNYQHKLNNLYSGLEEGREVMLCIMPDEFVNSFQVYADWKRQSGIDIHVTKFTDINANSSDPDIIKAHITDAYQNWDHPPTYVLIIGDNNIFPKKIVNYDYSFPNEDYFVEIEGNDFFPEMMIGRFTNQGDYRMQVMINKYMKYEKEPYVANTDWFKKGICCSNNDYESQIKVKRFAAERMMLDGAFTSVDTLMSDGTGSGCSMDVYDVINALNEGRSFLNYRGEGWSDGWWASCTPLNTSHVSGLSNGEKFTFVTSIGCGVAMFNAGGGNCFGEEWIQMGTISAPRGGVAFVGPTSNTHTTYNNKIDKGIYVGMFTEKMETPGEALLRGKLYMFNVFGSDPWVEYHYRVFCILGDPSIHIWKDVPQNVTVAHPATIPVGYSQSEFYITHTSTGLPVANARICLTSENVFASATTDSPGKVFLGFTPLAEDTLTVTVTGGNVYPYQGSLYVLQTNEHVGPEAMPVIDDIDGNMNGIINPNENCTISFILKNWGNQTASNVQATISTADTNIQVVTTNPVNFYNLPTGASYNGDPFQFLVKPTCPVGHTFNLQLHVTSNNGNWDYQFSDMVSGCDLYYNGYIVNDDSALVSNYRMDPGETVKLFLTVKNTGTDNAPNVGGILSSNDQYITVLDSTGSFGTIIINGEEMSSGNYFEVSVDANCPVDHLAVFSLKLFTESGSYPYEATRNFTIQIGSPTSNDYTGPDNYGYYAYSSDDSLFIQKPDFEWDEINTIGNQVTITSSDYTQTVALPFTFKYYGLDYTQLRISSDGWIAFGSGSQTAYENQQIPSVDNINCMVAPFWDDLFDNGWDNGRLFYYHDFVNHRFIVEWDSISHWNDQSNPKKETFQVVLNDPAYYLTPTGDGEILFQYKYVSQQSSATVGIENHSQDDGIQYVFNNGYDITASDIRSNFAIKFTTEPPYIFLSDDELNPIASESGYYLGQNIPNPFSKNTSIRYTIPEDTWVKLTIFDIHGQVVNDLINEHRLSGNHTAKWNGKDDSGKVLSSGVYFYRLQTDKFISTKKLFLIR